MAMFGSGVIDALKKKLDTGGYEALTTSELLIVISSHFNDEVTGLKSAARGSVVALWAVAAGIIANLVVR